jgi:hypothetical protein
MTAASGWTNRGLKNILAVIFNGASLPANFYVALVTSAAAPTEATNTKSELTEIANGDGYTTGGYQLTKNTTDFPTITETDASHLASILIKDVVWTASGGAIPISGDGARYAILTDANATQGSREVWAFWDLSSDRTVSTGQALTLHLLQMVFYSAGTLP